MHPHIIPYIYSSTVYNKTDPAKALVLGYSCWEVRWHSWSGFASKASLAQHIDISMVAQFELRGILQ